MTKIIHRRFHLNEKKSLIVFLFSIRKAIGIIIFAAITNFIYSQPCDPNVPSLTVDLSSTPNTTWISPAIFRVGNCCGTSPPAVCVEFLITLHPNAQGIIFDIYSGAVPGGSMFYQIDCGPQTPVGQIICLDGQGPHRLTFCKPGNNSNEYIISSIPEPSVSANLVLNEGCNGVISTSGYEDSTISITSIYPDSIGTYNNFLSCPSGCASTNVVAYSAYPPYVLYKVCGLPIGGCSSSTFCDTVMVTFNSTLIATITPTQPTLCYGQTSTTITVSGSGGTPPYSFLWNTGSTATSITAVPGTYTVILSDASGCPPAQATVTVTIFTEPITAAAGPDQSLCITATSVNLSGTVTIATGGIWTGGAGVYSPSNTSLNMTYYPTSAEILSGAVTLTLTSTGNGSCPSVNDNVVIWFYDFLGSISITATPVNCNGLSNGSVQVNVTGGTAPHSYLWSTSPPQTSQTASGLPAGSYNVTITDGVGCVSTADMQQ